MAFLGLYLTTDFGPFNFPRGLEQFIQVQPWDTWPGLAGFKRKPVAIGAESHAKGQSATKTTDTLLSTTPFVQMKWIQLSSHSLGSFRG